MQQIIEKHQLDWNGRLLEITCTPDHLLTHLTGGGPRQSQGAQPLSGKRAFADSTPRPLLAQLAFIDHHRRRRPRQLY
jgi:hypothetical protein